MSRVEDALGEFEGALNSCEQSAPDGITVAVMGKGESNQATPNVRVRENVLAAFARSNLKTRVVGAQGAQEVAVGQGFRHRPRTLAENRMPREAPSRDL